MTKNEQCHPPHSLSVHLTWFVLLTLLPLLLSGCGTLEIGTLSIHGEPTAIPAPRATTAAPASTPTLTFDTSGWNGYSNSAFGVSLLYPAGWRPVAQDTAAKIVGIRFAGEAGFFEIGAITGDTLDSIAIAETEHPSQPYGSQPVIETLHVDGQEARLVLPSIDQPADMNGQSALIVRYPQPVNFPDRTYEFFLLRTDQEHIQAIAQSLRFSSETAPVATAAPLPVVTWETLPPGLAYQAGLDVWRINAEEEPVLLPNVHAPAFSLDGTALINYDSSEQDGWLINLAEDKMWNLTHTPERQECCFRWWPGQPNIVLFQSLPIDGRGAPDAGGYLTAVGTDGQGYHILDPEHPFGAGQFAPSPDGRTIAYGDGQTSWLYQQGGSQVFDPAYYGLVDSGTGIQINQPAWSPDGRRLAWIVKGDVAPDGRSAWTGVAVFDLVARTVQVLHPYESQGVGWPPAPVWSPDGAWLAFGDGSPSDQAGLWVAWVEGDEQTQEHHLGLGGNPVWSPDGRWLAFQAMGHNAPPTYDVIEISTWKRRTLDVPVDRYGQLLDWTLLDL